MSLGIVSRVRYANELRSGQKCVPMVERPVVIERFEVIALSHCLILFAKVILYAQTASATTLAVTDFKGTTSGHMALSMWDTFPFPKGKGPTISSSQDTCRRSEKFQDVLVTIPCWKF